MLGFRRRFASALTRTPEAPPSSSTRTSMMPRLPSITSLASLSTSQDEQEVRSEKGGQDHQVAGEVWRLY
ncbi:hypothetical protein LOK49_LG15G02210 [Camellia lanceoleosa]|uniref:Uncharacterized protein n=1 Tax=Camellia lanceoleosa TaxID=1840588 RepID=A0ACC0F7H1_9ERIC|nr:hypothetical protein LOK49_LG15G02210 [Camellia lanceoleosa]